MTFTPNNMILAPNKYVFGSSFPPKGSVLLKRVVNDTFPIQNVPFPIQSISFPIQSISFPIQSIPFPIQNVPFPI